MGALALEVVALVLKVKVKRDAGGCGAARASRGALNDHGAAKSNRAAESHRTLGRSAVGLGAESGVDRSSLGGGCVNSDSDTVGVSDTHNGVGADAGANSSDLRGTSVRANSRRVDERMTRSETSRGGSASAPDSSGVGHAIGSTSTSSNAGRAEEVLVVVVVLAVVLSVTKARDSNGRAGESQDGELGVDRRHLFKSSDEKDRED